MLYTMPARYIFGLGTIVKSWAFTSILELCGISILKAYHIHDIPCNDDQKGCADHEHDIQWHYNGVKHIMWMIASTQVICENVESITSTQLNPHH